MNWEELYSMQQSLDNHIESNHQLKNQDLFQEKYLALLVELGELANETRCFKFWSNKSRNNNDIILEEYVDGLHFILSLGLEKGYRYTSRNLSELTRAAETEQFNIVFESCINFYKNVSKETYEQLFMNFLLLGEVLGFSESDIQVAYYKKNEINFERQNKGY
ncbi:dUTP diphosphatase [Oceanobacillus caeni]|uniref:dUTP diphosphatase n=1 Tax=Oceanobacillus TaxID=182709 RepID=UPI0006222BC1|nr:dUTP diphosphatase [Oceanobacillus caeni]KKE79021.1 dUTPase [Bacilli bacterium VT-13-104]PZD83640.1 dUTPase [Bacilli bacterium]MBU8789600.1 dUTP diphosphatase [Oceanobacillus caeni]MCR1834161.1 dUTP diphosphatase [Oceanobacillus caeni]PZD85387.1 dUTPase [Bacilli bacterium]